VRVRRLINLPGLLLLGVEPFHPQAVEEVERFHSANAKRADQQPDQPTSTRGLLLLGVEPFYPANKQAAGQPDQPVATCCLWLGLNP